MSEVPSSSNLEHSNSSYNTVPADVNEAMKSTQWQEVVYNELQALINNKTWTLCALPKSRRSIGCKSLFRVKKKPDGSVERYKARLVAKGFS